MQDFPQRTDNYNVGGAADAAKRELVNAFLRGVYWWMTAGLALTGAMAWLVYNSPTMRQIIFGNKLVFIGFIIAELVLVIFLSARIQRLAGSTATMLFMLYSALNGATLSAILLVYTSWAWAGLRPSFHWVGVAAAGVLAGGLVFGKPSPGGRPARTESSPRERRRRFSSGKKDSPFPSPASRSLTFFRNRK